LINSRPSSAKGRRSSDISDDHSYHQNHVSFSPRHSDYLISDHTALEYEQRNISHGRGKGKAKGRTDNRGGYERRRHEYDLVSPVVDNDFKDSNRSVDFYVNGSSRDHQQSFIADDDNFYQCHNEDEHQRTGYQFDQQQWLERKRQQHHSSRGQNNSKGRMSKGGGKGKSNKGSGGRHYHHETENLSSGRQQRQNGYCDHYGANGDSSNLDLNAMTIDGGNNHSTNYRFPYPYNSQSSAGKGQRSSNIQPSPACSSFFAENLTGALSDVANDDNGTTTTDASSESLCPICANDLIGTDQNFVACPCQFKVKAEINFELSQVCAMCVHCIREEADGKCPNCRRTYDEKNFRLVEYLFLSRLRILPAETKVKRRQPRQARVSDRPLTNRATQNRSSNDASDIFTSYYLTRPSSYDQMPLYSSAAVTHVRQQSRQHQYEVSEVNNDNNFFNGADQLAQSSASFHLRSSASWQPSISRGNQSSSSPESESTPVAIGMTTPKASVITKQKSSSPYTSSPFSLNAASSSLLSSLISTSEHHHHHDSSSAAGDCCYGFNNGIKSKANENNDTFGSIEPVSTFLQPSTTPAETRPRQPSFTASSIPPLPIVPPAPTLLPSSLIATAGDSWQDSSFSSSSANSYMAFEKVKQPDVTVSIKSIPTVPDVDNEYLLKKAETCESSSSSSSTSTTTVSSTSSTSASLSASGFISSKGIVKLRPLTVWD
jgi:hypothetical protein